MSAREDLQRVLKLVEEQAQEMKRMALELEKLQGLLATAKVLRGDCSGDPARPERAPDFRKPKK